MYLKKETEVGRRSTYAYQESNIYVLTIIFGSLGLMNIVSTDITLPIMFVFMGLTFLTNARECYDNGAKKDAMIFAGVAIFVYVVTVYNLVSRFM